MASLPRSHWNSYYWLSAFLCCVLAASHAHAEEELRWRTPRLDSSTFPAAQLSPPIGIPTRSDNAPAEIPLFLPTPTQPEPLPPPLLPPAMLPAAGASQQPSESWDPLGYFFSHADDTIPAIADWERTAASVHSPLSSSKPGFFQKFALSGSWLEGGTESRAPAMTDVSAYSTFAVPFPINEWPLAITPGGGARWLDGPRNPDLPAALYDTYLDFTWNIRITQRSTQVFSVAPGYYSDFQQNSGHALRVTGKWVSYYDVVKNRITLVTGTIYLGRDDLKLLPMGGLAWTPNEWSRFDAVFPNPRAAFRLQANDFFEDWLYTGADFFGGQTWAIQRASDTRDRVSILDNRVVFGYERRRGGGAGWNLEGGWVFDRRVHYHNTPGSDFSPNPTYYARAGITF